jgi:serine/threonine protein kinase
MERETAFFSADISDTGQVEAMFEAFLARFRSIDILVTPKILDFGLARIMPVVEEPEEANQLGSQDETRTLDANQLNKPVKPPTDPSAMSPGPKLMGTPSYMSPEQAESELFDIPDRVNLFDFEISADGNRFLATQLLATDRTPSISMVENWHAEFKDK